MKTIDSTFLLSFQEKYLYRQKWGLFFLFIIPVLFSSCAYRIAPEGGPIDLTTPEIISTYPDSNALNFIGSHLKFEFDRYVDELSFKESIFISPNIGELEFDWSGSEVLVTFSGKLKPNTTYVVNIGADVRDRFINQKHMEKSFSLAFSTGPEIDRGAIEGQVFPMKDGEQVNGIMIFAYLLDELNSDTLNPKTSPPDFITQTGKSGDFFLHHIPFGDYRIFAIRDEYRNLIYDQEVDEYAIQPNPICITVTDTLVSGIIMKLTKEDTTKPRLIKATALDRNRVVAEFSENLDLSVSSLSSFTLKDTVTEKTLQIISCYPTFKDGKSLTLITANQDSTIIYRLTSSGIKDSVGNLISPFANSINFNGSAKIDTLGPKLVSISIKDSSRNISLRPKIFFVFSNALLKDTLLDWVNIYNEKQEKILCRKKWIDDITVRIEPEELLTSKAWYSLKAELRDLKDWASRVCIDSTKTWKFETIDVEDFSSMEGIVVDMNKNDAIGKIFVMAIQVDEKTTNRYIVEADAENKFIFPQVAEGRYILQAFRDRNNNGKYDYGKPFPFEYSERLSQVSEIFKVRARWPLEGLVVKMK